DRENVCLRLYSKRLGRYFRALPRGARYRGIENEGVFAGHRQARLVDASVGGGARKNRGRDHEPNRQATEVHAWVCASVRSSAKLGDATRFGCAPIKKDTFRLSPAVVTSNLEKRMFFTPSRRVYVAPLLAVLCGLLYGLAARLMFGDNLPSWARDAFPA